MADEGKKLGLVPEFQTQLEKLDKSLRNLSPDPMDAMVFYLGQISRNTTPYDALKSFAALLVSNPNLTDEASGKIDELPAVLEAKIKEGVLNLNEDVELYGVNKPASAYVKAIASCFGEKGENLRILSREAFKAQLEGRVNRPADSDSVFDEGPALEPEDPRPVIEAQAKPPEASAASLEVSAAPSKSGFFSGFSKGVKSMFAIFSKTRNDEGGPKEPKGPV
jgi:hypothetical protein